MRICSSNCLGSSCFETIQTDRIVALVIGILAMAIGIAIVVRVQGFHNMNQGGGIALFCGGIIALVYSSLFSTKETPPPAWEPLSPVEVSQVAIDGGAAPAQELPPEVKEEAVPLPLGIPEEALQEPQRLEPNTFRVREALVACFDELVKSPKCTMDEDQIAARKAELLPLELPHSVSEFYTFALSLDKILSLCLSGLERQDFQRHPYLLSAYDHLTTALSHLGSLYLDTDLAKAFSCGKMMRHGSLEKNNLLTQIALVHLNQGRLTEALEAIKAISYDASIRTQLLVKLFNIEFKKGEIEKATAVLKELRYGCHEQKVGFVQLFNHYLGKRAFDQALKMAKELLYGSDEQKELLVQLFKRHFKAGRFELAKSALKELRSGCQEQKEGFIQLHHHYFQLRNYSKALEMLKELSYGSTDQKDLLKKDAEHLLNTNNPDEAYKFAKELPYSVHERDDLLEKIARAALACGKRPLAQAAIGDLSHSFVSKKELEALLKGS